MSGAAAASKAANAAADTPAPSLKRRLACFVYEAVLLFGVLMIAGYLFSSLTQQRHALVGRHGLQAFLFIILGIYFGWFWSRSGQTVAMKAWHIRVIGPDGQAPSQTRALMRYLFSWLWFAPALLTLALAGQSGLPSMLGILGVGVLAYAALSGLHPQRQFLHDALCGTRLVTALPPRPQPTPGRGQ